MGRIKLSTAVLLSGLFIQGQSLLVDYPDDAVQGGPIINFHDIAYGPGGTIGYSYNGMIGLAIQYNYLFEKDGNYELQNFMPCVKFFPLKPFTKSKFQLSLEFYYLNESYFLKKYYLDNKPKRIFYRFGGVLSYKIKMQKIYTVLPELGVFRTLKYSTGVNFSIDDEYPAQFLDNAYRDSIEYMEVKFSFSLIKPLRKNLDLVIQFQNFMNRDEYQDQFLIQFVRYL